MMTTARSITGHHGMRIAWLIAGQRKDHAPSVLRAVR